MPQQMITKLNTMNGELKLAFSQKGGRTKLIDSYHASPLKASKALYLDEEGSATVYLMETSGGMVAGDWNQYTISLDQDSRVTLIPQSSTKIYPTRENIPCRQTIDVQLNENARLVWMPETTIPFENSIFFSQSKIRLHSSSCLLFSEIFSSGRQKSEESFEFQRFSSKTQLYVDDKLIVYDHLDVKQDSAWAQLGMFEECTYMGVIWYVDPAWATSNYEELTKSFQQGRHHRFGYSNLDDYGVHFRWLSNDLCLLKEQMLAIMEGLGQVPRPS